MRVAQLPGRALRVRDRRAPSRRRAPGRRPRATKRSTSTVVLPVPAPAETKTSPGASIAASCSAFSASSPMHADPAHRPEVAPARAVAARRVVLDVSRPGSARDAPSRVLRAPLDLRPRTPPRRGSRSSTKPGQRLRGAPRAAVRALFRSPASGAVEAAQRLHPDEVTEHEHVQRDLQPQLATRSCAAECAVLPDL